MEKNLKKNVYVCITYHFAVYLKHCKSAMSIAQLCPTVCDPTDSSPPGFSVHGILQARILEWIAIPFCRGSSQPRDQTGVSHVAGRFFIVWANREAPKSATLQFFKKCDQFSPTIASTSLFSTEVNLPSQPFHRQLPLIIFYSTIGPDWRVVK